MNAAFLILTTAWMAAGDVAAPPPVGAAPAPAPAMAAPAVITGTGSCGGGCGSTCGDPCCKPKFGEKLKGLFHHHDCGCAAPCAPTCAPAPVYHAPVCKPACEPACKPVHVWKPLFHHEHECGCAAPAPTCAPVCDPCKHKFSFHFKGLFHKECGCETGCGGCGTLAPIAPQMGAPVDGPKDPMPKPKAGTTIGSIAPATIGIQDANSPFDLRRRYESRVSNTADYSSLTGQLFFVHTDGGRWVVRYAPVSKEDRFGGSVVLARDVQMDAYSDGDLVTINGEILSEKATFPLGGALYRANKLTVIEKGSDEGKTE